MFHRHEEAQALLPVAPEVAFDYLDDFRKLSAHMEQRSGMLMGSRMAIETDAEGGQAIGSVVRMHGKALGIALDLEEVVVERQPPLRKAWETRAARLAVIGNYRLGFELVPEGGRTRARIHIDYDLPSGAARLLGIFLGRTYARWCVERMARDAEKQFLP